MALEKTYLIIESSDGDQFNLEKSIAIKSSITIKNMLQDDVTTNIIPLPDVDTATLSKIVKYIETHATDISDSKTKNIYDQKLLGSSFKSLVKIVLGARYLRIKTLHELCTREIAKRIKNMSYDEICDKFDYSTYNFSTEKYEAVCEEFEWAFEGRDDTDDFVTYRDIAILMLLIFIPCLWADIWRSIFQNFRYRF